MWYHNVIIPINYGVLSMKDSGHKAKEKKDKYSIIGSTLWARFLIITKNKMNFAF